MESSSEETFLPKSPRPLDYGPLNFTIFFLPGIKKSSCKEVLVYMYDFSQ